MAQWNYTLKWGKQLHEAIEAENTEMVVKCLIACYRELLNKLSDEDKEWKQFYIKDTIDILTYYDADPDDEDDVNYYLEEFYDICDDVRAWIAI